ncbi:hypothetical protein ACFQ14_05050 [Pseudahrensia aquimaris]|uniref:Uncharacterized protein n=1 Tax=Pseudahrensia aquimaris TaxID=744461 RepID=A0ABW3FE96_9HYPH
MTDNTKIKPRKRNHINKWLVATLVVICALQVATAFVVTRHVVTLPSEASPHYNKCEPGHALRPKFPRAFPDACATAPINHKSRA